MTDVNQHYPHLPGLVSPLLPAGQSAFLPAQLGQVDFFYKLSRTRTPVPLGRWHVEWISRAAKRSIGIDSFNGQKANISANAMSMDFEETSIGLVFNGSHPSAK